MLKIFQASTSTFASLSETLAIQRNARWGLNLLQEEVLQAGFLLPPYQTPGLNPTSASAQPPLLMQKTGYTPPDETVPVDELQMVVDMPLNVEGTLTKDPTKGDITLSVKIPSGASDVRDGDLLMVQDSNWEVFLVQDASSDTVNIKPITATPTQDAYGNQTQPFAHSSVQFAHRATAEFAFYRPMSVVRYTVVPRKLDPSDPTAVVPCLVRQRRPLSVSPNTIWAPDMNTPQTTLPADEQILLEGVTGFRVDWSFDAGKTWIRASGSGDDWANIRGVVNTLLTTSSSSVVNLSQGVTNLQDPYWPRYTPILIRLDISTRTRLKRTEYNANLDPNNPKAEFRTRTETLLLSPRNFGLGAL
ncbi:hypothetical protein [Geothrix fuzhouensis]|uniref:hypothetical protein n=1 Tax=Geothrix fuzhouensis TaxID=2966451 RepID=UPI002147AABA|nr:hypothetical protein [Geothrix fuzhouensis]